MNVNIGTTATGDLTVDIPVLLRTRLLVQANSGGGKGWLLRRFAEQIFGRVPTLILDPEGEFATLREKFDFVLVGKGGETAADPRSAELVARKLLELRASAVVDLYDLKPSVRHQYVRLFLEAVMNAPKNLWRPTVIIVDEAHKFCPERSAGESEASEAMIDLATAGRKRGFCAVFATQRLGKLRKDASAELLNRLVGPTFEDVDLDRAADILSVNRADKTAFFAEMKLLEPGNFWALGRALAKTRTLVKVGKVETSHPDVSSGRYTAEPPPAPEKIKALLPKLADLPKAAEERARTLEAVQQENRELKRQLRERPAATDRDPEALKKTVDREVEKARKEFTRQFSTVHSTLVKLQSEIDRRGHAAFQSLELLRNVKVPEIPVDLSYAPPTITPARIPAATPSAEVAAIDAGDKKLGACERAILGFLVHADRKPWTKEQVGIATCYSPTSGGFGNSLGALTSLGMISRNNGTIQLVGVDPALQLQPVRFDKDRLKAKFGKCEREILDVLFIASGSLTKEDLAEKTVSNYSPTSGGFGNSLGTLSTWGIIKRERGMIRFTDEMVELVHGN